MGGPISTPNDVYLVYVTNSGAIPYPLAPGGPGALLALGPGGTSFPDSFTAAGSIGAALYLFGLQTVNQLADPHEMTHVTTNLRNSAAATSTLARMSMLAPATSTAAT